MKKLLVILTLLPMMAFGFTGPNSHQIMGEFEALTTLIEITKPDYEVGGYFQGKDFKNDVKLLWRLTGDTDSHQTIRLIRRRESGVMFAVTYHLTKYIVDGRLVLRRFVGTEPTGWINHTIDFETGEYLGSQGYDPYLLEIEEEILSDWAITL